MYTARRFPRNDSVSAWVAMLPRRTPQPALSGKLTVDIVIVGGGFAGLAAARRMNRQDPTLRIALLEAQEVSQGATGRNSGFIIDLPHEVSAEDYGGHVGGHDRPDIQANRTAIALAREMAEENGWGRDIFDPCGKYNVAMGAKGDHHVQTYATQLKGLGEAHRVLNAREIAEVTGSQAFTSAIYTPGTVMVQPAAYVRKVADLLAHSIHLFENSPVQSMERQGAGWVVKTAKGAVSAGQVILATNGHAESFGLFRGQLLHVFTYASMTQAFDPARLGGERQWAATPASPMGTTLRRVRGADGDRILVRSRYTYHASLEVSAADIASAGQVHDRKFADRFPALAGVPMQYRWAGAMALTWNSVPAFGEVEPGLFAACACNGVGATKATANGIAAADAVLQIDSPLLRNFRANAAPRRLPPQPFLSIGAKANLKLREWGAGKE
jgi:glycine/D-amino acid oxidase-like deaminating enzyme